MTASFNLFLRVAYQSIALVTILLLASSVASAQHVTRIGFGSCSHQDKPQPIWTSVLEDKPDAFIFLGDNIYGDSDDIDVLKEKYARLAAIPGFAALRKQAATFAIWDDHDYGRNDAGKDYPSKEASRQLLLDFWEEPESSPRRTQDGGIYTSILFTEPAASAHLRGKEPRVIQLLLLDLRWNRTALNEVTNKNLRAQRLDSKRGPYEVILDPGAELLGASQWTWLENEFAKDVDLRLVGSSIQVLAEFTGWESWANFPRERLALLDLVNRYSQVPTVFMSGDTHWSELSRIPQLEKPTLIELTSSGLTEEWKAISPNRHRVGPAFAEANYGLISVEWNEVLDITLEIKNVNGEVLIRDIL